MINVLADQYLFNIKSFLPPQINLDLYDPAQGLPEELDHIHALLIRTVSPINKQTLPTIPDDLEFIGTGSAGTDHVDKNYLRNSEIAFADAAGCNARSVAEYIATALLLWSEDMAQDLSKITVGIVGVGHVGSQVSQLLQALGIQTVKYDPPREIRDNNFETASLDEVLACDTLTFHTPLTPGGNNPTYHWLDAKKLAGRTFQLVINAARGGVVDEEILMKSLTEGRVGDIILDVWENEPNFNDRSAGMAYIKTPHVAGYSVQAKNNASRLVAESLLDHFGLTPQNKQGAQQKQVFKSPLSDFDELSPLLKEVHPIEEYDAALQDIMDRHQEEKGKYFNRLRAEFPLRQEFRNIYLSAPFFEKFPLLKSLGFSLGSESK